MLSSKNVNLDKGALRSAPVLPPVELGTLSFELVTLQLVLLSAVLIQHISIPSKLIVRRLDNMFLNSPINWKK